MKTMRDKTTVEQEQMALHSYPPDKGGKGTFHISCGKTKCPYLLIRDLCSRQSHATP